ncbi:MAG: phenylalanine--tRNA ligase subunit beta [Nanoarchaeota archaeon]|nr:phenylalanine--tRNA ligase subunit beta [Nanoarchaeota archaeon]
MVYVYTTLNELNKYSQKELSIDEISQTLIDIGMDLKGVNEDENPELKIEITAEKFDMISSIGISRAINSYLELQDPIIEIPLKRGREKVIVDKSVQEVRPKTVAAIVRNLELTEEKLQTIIDVQEKIHESFGRHRKKAAIGVYPINNITFPIHFKALEPEKIKFQPLESDVEMSAIDMIKNHATCKKYAHLLEGARVYPIFSDSKDNILSLPPLINSHDTGRVEISHRDLFMEVSGHNEHHLHNVLVTLVSVLEQMGGEIESMQVEYAHENNYVYELNLNPKAKVLTREYISSLVGVEFTNEEIIRLGKKMMYQVKEINQNELEFTIPCYKLDIFSACDIADDIARAYGYNNIESISPQIPMIGEEINFSKLRREIRQICANQGNLELYTYMLTSTQNQFDKMSKDVNSEQFIKIKDAAEEGINMMRTRLIAEMLHSLHLNRKVKYPQRVFEVGMTIQRDDSQDTKARNQWHLANILAGPQMSYTQIKEMSDTLFKLLGVFDDIEYIQTSRASFIEGRCAQIMYKKEKLGVIGEIYPKILENFGLLVPVSAYEINLEVFRELD